MRSRLNGPDMWKECEMENWQRADALKVESERRRG